MSYSAVAFVAQGSSRAGPQLRPLRVGMRPPSGPVGKLEIALNKEVGKTVLSTRMMDLLIVHTEAIDEEATEFFQYLHDRDIGIPVMVVGEEAQTLSAPITERAVEDQPVRCFDKPYPVQELLGFIEEL